MPPEEDELELDMPSKQPHQFTRTLWGVLYWI